MRGLLVSALGLALFLGACGKSVASPRVPRASATPGGQPGGSPGAVTPGLPPTGPDGAALLGQLRARLARTQAIEVEVKASSSGRYYGGKRVEAERQSSSTSRMIWATPSRLQARVQESTTPMLAGAMLVMSTPGQVKVKGAGALGLVPVSMKVTDTRLLTNRNHAFTDNHPIAHLRRLTTPEVTWVRIAALPAAPQAHWVTVGQARRLDPEITAEVLALDPTTLSPVALAMLVDSRPVVTFTYSGFNWEATPSAATFKL